eukprot:gene1267-1765_t
MSSGATPSYRLGVDVGGTFTDLLLINEATGETHSAKVPSTPADSSVGVLNGIVGEGAFSAPLAAWLTDDLHVPERIAGGASTALVVVIITFLTIVFGELVPKRL